MQPYFFPYLGHFALISACDSWIVFDISQYTRKSWMNRNRILHPKQGWQYISIPVENATLGIATSQILVKDLDASRDELLGKLSHYCKVAPYYKQVVSLVKECFAAVADNRLVTLNIQSLKAVTSYLGMSFNYQICSELDLTFSPDMAPGDWALEISRQYGANTYINPSSGLRLFDPAAFERADIKLGFSYFDPFVYHATGRTFEAGLSIIDVMMWCSPEEIKNAIVKLHHIDYV
ncbi:WbqC family protein [Rheinheimera metallidurans]|uniref:WbqC family protein n=1 Tax=Rheinheimera metallidurans TaxID=2925781 RepID=UPI0030010E2D